MATHVLLVRDVTVARGQRLLLPRIDAPSGGRGPFRARLVGPDGATREVQIALEVSHVRGPLPPFAMVRLLDDVDVVPGTRLEWDT